MNNKSKLPLFLVVLAIFSMALNAMVALAAEKPRIGIIAPFSGPYKEKGREIANGVNVAIQKAGDVIDVVECDSASDPETASICAEELISSGVIAIIGPWHDCEVKRILPAVENSQTPTVIPASKKQSSLLIFQIEEEKAPKLSSAQKATSGYMAFKSTWDNHKMQMECNIGDCEDAEQFIGFGRDPRGLEPFGYDAAMAILEAKKNAEKTKGSLLNELENTDFPGATKQVTFIKKENVDVGTSNDLINKP